MVLHPAGYSVSHFKIFDLADPLAQSFGPAVQMHRARIAILVNAMANAHDLGFLRHLVVNIGINFGWIVDLEQHVHRINCSHLLMYLL